MAESKHITLEGTKLVSWQREASKVFKSFDQSNNILLILSPRQRGKTLFNINCLLYTSLNSAGASSIVISPTNKQNLKIFTDFKKHIVGTPIVKSLNESQLIIRFQNGSSIYFLSAEQRDSLRGYTVSSGGILVIDEAAYISDDIFEIILPYTNVHKSNLIISSTPRFKSGKFYSLFKQSHHHLNKKVHLVDASKFPSEFFITSDQLAIYRSSMSQFKFKTEYLGEFSDANLGTLFGDLTSCFKDSFDDEGIVYAGLDFGSGRSQDYTVLTLFNKDGHLVRMWRDNKLGPRQAINVLCKMINAITTIKRISLEMNSIGAIYCDLLKDGTTNKKIKFEEFYTSNESKKKIIEQLISNISNGNLQLVNDDNLKYELESFEIKQLQNNNYTYQAGPGMHDDIIMSLAIGYNGFLQDTTKKSFRITLI